MPRRATSRARKRAPREKSGARGTSGCGTSGTVRRSPGAAEELKSRARHRLRATDSYRRGGTAGIPRQAAAGPRSRSTECPAAAPPRLRRSRPARERKCGSRCWRAISPQRGRRRSRRRRLALGHEQDEEIRGDDRPREKGERRGQTVAVGDQPSEERPDRGAERLRAEEDADARPSHVAGRALEEPRLQERPDRIEEETEHGDEEHERK